MMVPFWIPAVFIHEGDAEWPGQTEAIWDTCKIALLHRHLVLRKKHIVSSSLAAAGWGGRAASDCRRAYLDSGQFYALFL